MSRNINLLITFFIAMISLCNAQAGENQIDDRAARIELMNIYIGELETLWKMRQTATKEQAADQTTTDRLSTSITVGTRTINAMNGFNDRLEALKLNPAYNKARNLILDLNEARTIVNKQIVEGAKFAISAKPSDLERAQKLAGEAAELVAQSEEINNQTYKASAAVAISLLDENRLDAKGNMTHLILSEKERKDTIAMIDKIFGKEIEKDNHDYFVEGASTIKYQLSRGLPTSDAP